MQPEVKVVVPFCNLSTDTMAALERDGIKARFQTTATDDRAYARLLCQLWAEGETVVLLEQDKVPAPGAIRAIHDCDSPWCAYPVDMHQTGRPADFPTLSCVKFSDLLMERWPDLMERVAAHPMGDTPPGHYSRLDMAVALWAHRRAGPVHWHPAGMIEHHHAAEEAYR